MLVLFFFVVWVSILSLVYEFGWQVMTSLGES